MPAVEEIELSEAQLVRSICEQSFFDFVVEFWDTIVPEKPVWNWHIPYLCNELQIVAERVFDDMPKLYDVVINVPPGSTKSTICSIMYPAWIWTRMNTARIIGGSYSANLAMDLALKNRDIVLSEKYQECWGWRWEQKRGRNERYVQLRQDQMAKSNFANTKGGVRFCVGVGGSITGRHGHFIIIDDPINPKEGRSEVALKAANQWMTETLPTRKVDKGLTPTILIMQRLHQNDCTANMIERAETSQVPIKHICLPALVSEFVKPEELKEKYIDGQLDPLRLSPAVLNEAKANGPYQFAGQFMQYPVPDGGGTFKWQKIKVEEWNTRNRWKMRVRYWDKAATHDDGCYTVGLLMGRDVNDHYWILDVVRGQWGTGEREEIIKQTAELDGQIILGYVEQEPGSGGKDSAFATIKMLAGYRYRADRPTGDKVFRAEPWAYQVDIGNVSMVPGPWNKTLLSEMEYFPASTYKDQVDAGSGAFNMLAKGRTRVGAFGR